MIKRLCCTAVFVVFLVTTTAASPVSASTLKSCKQILAKYPNGVARNRGGADAVVALGFARPTIQRRVYAGARKLDRFKDNTVCVTEANKRPLLAGLTAPAITSTNEAPVNGHPAVSTALSSAVANLGGTCMVAMRDGKIIGEWYSGGRTPTTKTIGMSTSKVLTTAVIGAAERLGRLKIDQPIADFIPDFKGTPKAAITIRHMLTHSSGLMAFPGQTAQVLNIGAGSVTAAALTLPLVIAPGSTYDYDTSNIALQLLMLVVERAVGEKFTSFADKYVLRPAGMANSVYKGDEPATNWDTGDPWLAAGLNTTCRDLARLGQLFHAKGSWAGQQLFSADFATQATSVQVSKVNNGGLVTDYGFLHNIIFGGVGHLGGCGAYVITRPSGVTVAAMSDTNVRTFTDTPAACAPTRLAQLFAAVRAVHDNL